MPAPSTYFGHQHITRKCLVSLMELLSDIYIEKYQWDDINSLYIPRKYIKVPIQYCSHQKFLQILQSSSARKTMPPEDSIAPVELQWILPRISVNLQGIVYDTERHYNKTEKIKMPDGNYVFAPVPYNLEVEISSIAKTVDDSFQIMEQILPMFSPGKSLDVKLYNEMSESIPIILNTVSFDFPQEVNQSEERLYSISYYFSIRSNYYMQKKSSTLITDINVNPNQMGIRINIDTTDTLFESYINNSLNPNPYGLNYNELSNIELHKTGNYDPDVTYTKYDLVSYNNNLFVWINDIDGNVLPGSTDWEKSWTFKSVINKNVVEVIEI